MELKWRFMDIFAGGNVGPRLSELLTFKSRELLYKHCCVSVYLSVPVFPPVFDFQIFRRGGGQQPLGGMTCDARL